MKKQHAIPSKILQWAITNYPAGVSRKIADYWKEHGTLPSHAYYNNKAYAVKSPYIEFMFSEAKAAAIAPGVTTARA